jgi:hypothetical protein
MTVRRRESDRALSARTRRHLVGDLRHDLVGCGDVQIGDGDARTCIDGRQHDRMAKAARSDRDDRDSAVDSHP